MTGVCAENPPLVINATLLVMFCELQTSRSQSHSPVSFTVRLLLLVFSDNTHMTGSEQGGALLPHSRVLCSNHISAHAGETDDRAPKPLL